jgi:KaiC/GvpD/RAD55 family RecA-like ATPase
LNFDEIKLKPEIIDLYRTKLALVKQGKDWLGKCPFHKNGNERTPSFSVHQSEKNQEWRWHCFGECNIDGDIANFIQKLDGVTFKQAQKIIEHFIQAETKLNQTFKQPITVNAKLISISLDKWGGLVKKLLENKEVLNWLDKERGITDIETLKRLNIGKAAIEGKDVIAFPSIQGDKVISIKYRSLDKKEFSRQKNMDTTALFNLSTVNLIEPVFLVEGEFDAIILEQAGFHAVSLQNVNHTLSKEQRDELLMATEVILAGDNDQAGIQGMAKLWTAFGERTYLLKWPSGCKDANEVFLTKCNRNIEQFTKLVNELYNQALARPMPNIYSLAESMYQSESLANLSDNPARFKFYSWSAVDKMAILLPGSVCVISSTNTGQGKTIFTMNFTIDAAMRGATVLNYQAEITVDEFANSVAAYLLSKDRNQLTQEDYQEAANLLSGTKYYIGRDPTLTTVQPALDLIEVAVKRFNPSIVVLDHIHFLCRNENNPVQAEANAMQRIVNMSARDNLIFFVVAQPRKAIQTYQGKPLHITSLKGSETLASDADAVISLHREFIKNIDPNNPPLDAYESRTTVQLLKARMKGIGKSQAPLEFEGKCAKFYETNLALTQDYVL